jgi:hypothetical protein
MSQPTPRPEAHNAPLQTSSRVKPVNRPFMGLLDSVLVESDGQFPFDGAIGFTESKAVWTWMTRDVAPDLAERFVSDPTATLAEFEAVLADILTRVRDFTAEAAKTSDGERRLKVTLGGEHGFNALPSVLYALRSRTLIEKAKTFGRAVNALTDEHGLVSAMQSMPLQDPKALALLMQAAIGQVANPTKLVTTAIRISGHATEASIVRAGYAPLIDSILCHAQAQLPVLQAQGMFADVDLMCRAVDRFHRLVRSVNGYVEINRGGRWAATVAGLTKTASDAVEPKLRMVATDVVQAMRRPREGVDRLDEDKLLDALNGVFLLVTVRDCRDSLALNALFEQSWAQTGQALETHLTRNLDIYRENPSDRMALTRLDAGIKMAELRFNPDYADVLRRARDAAGRRPAAS